MRDLGSNPYLVAVCPWISDLPSLGLSFPNANTDIKTDFPELWTGRRRAATQCTGWC